MLTVIFLNNSIRNKSICMLHALISAYLTMYSDVLPFNKLGRSLFTGELCLDIR